MEFEELLKSRNSAINFETNFRMTEKNFTDILALTKLAPSTYNLQPTKYLVLLDQELKETLCEISYNQHKISSSSAMVIVLGDKDAYTLNSAETIYAPMKRLGMIDENTYQMTMKQLVGYMKLIKSDGTGESLKKELDLNVTMSASFFILAAKNLGFDTCPMHIVNADAVRLLLNIPENLEPVLMIAIGKSVEDKKRTRGYRRLPEEVLTFNRY